MSKQVVPLFRRAVVALSGSESDDYTMGLVTSVASGASPHERPKIYLVHIVVLDWCLPLDADVA